MTLRLSTDQRFNSKQDGAARKKRRAQLQCANLEERLLLFNMSSAFTQSFSMGSNPSNALAGMGSFAPTAFEQMTTQLKQQSLAVQGSVASSQTVAAQPVRLASTLNASLASSASTPPRQAKATAAPATLSTGDFNNDGRIDLVDVNMLRRSFGLRGANARGMDMNGDGRLDLRDFALLRTRLAEASRPLGITIAAPSGARSATPRVTMTFDQRVTGFDLQDVRLTRDGVNILTGAESLTSADGKTFVLSGLSQESTRGGRFEFRVLSGASNIVGERYSRLPADASVTWTVQQGATTVSLRGVPTQPTSDNPDSVQIVFDQAVSGLTLANISLTHENGANLLTGQQTLTTTNGREWTLGNLRGLTEKAGVYRLNVNTPGVANDGTAVNLSAQARFAILAEIRSSDSFMRMIINAGHQFMQPERFVTMDHNDGVSLLTLGTRLNYAVDPNAFRSLLGASAPAGGAVTAQQAKDAYAELINRYENAHPEATTGSYIGARSIKGNQKASDLGTFPIDVLSIDPFKNLSVLDPIATSINNDGFLDVQDPDTLEAMFQNFYKEAVGLGSRPKQEIIHFDEVGYVYGDWPKLVELFSRLKTALHNEGVLVSINLGGWAWTKAFNIVSPTVIQDLTKMADSVMIESIWSNEPKAPGGTFRNVENTQLIINNLRAAMDAGLNINLLPTQHTANQNILGITSVTEVEVNGETKLLATLNRDHHIFPSGGRVQDQFHFSELTGQYANLNGVRWTAEEVPGKGNQVYLKSTWNTLAEVKAAHGITGQIALSGGKLHDLQANTRMNAALALLARNPGDKILVHYSPGYTMPGDADPNHPDNWWYWPAQLGKPTAEYVVDSTGPQGQILTMHRDFANGTLIVHPTDGWVEVKLNKATNVLAIS